MGQSEECGHQVETGTGGSGIDSGEEQTEWLKTLDEMTEDRLVKKVFVEDVPRQ